MKRQDALLSLKELRGTPFFSAVLALLDSYIDDEKEKLVTAEGSAMLHGQGAVQIVRRIKSEIQRETRPKQESDGAY